VRHTYDPTLLDGVTEAVDLKYGFDIKNIGKTPASIIELSIRFNAPDGWTRYTSGDKFTRSAQTFTDIAQDGTFQIRNPLEIFQLTDEALNEFNNERTGRVIRSVTMQGHLAYRDVFRDEYDVEWCWTVDQVGGLHQCDMTF